MPEKKLITLIQSIYDYYFIGQKQGRLTILNQLDYSVKASLNLNDSPLKVIQKKTNTGMFYALVFCNSGWIYAISLATF